MNKLNTRSTIALKDKVVAHHISDGSELIPAEIKANKPEESNQYQNKSLDDGYVIDDEGIINNYATEPGIYLANHPSFKQQKNYFFWGLGAIGLVAMIFLIAFVVS